MLNQLRYNPNRLRMFRPDPPSSLECPPPLITPTYQDNEQVGTLITPVDNGGNIVTPEPTEHAWNSRSRFPISRPRR